MTLVFEKTEGPSFAVHGDMYTRRPDAIPPSKQTSHGFFLVRPAARSFNTIYAVPNHAHRPTSLVMSTSVNPHGKVSKDRVRLLTQSQTTAVHPFESCFFSRRQPQGKVSKNRVRFVHGHSAWAPGQLHDELDHNQVRSTRRYNLYVLCSRSCSPVLGAVCLGNLKKALPVKNERSYATSTTF